MAAARPRDRPARRDKCIGGSDACHKLQLPLFYASFIALCSVLAVPAELGLVGTGFTRSLDSAAVSVPPSGGGGARVPERAGSWE